jgi:hypothetical protein
VAAIDAGRGAASRRAEGTPGRDLLTGHQVAKFGVMVGFVGIFFDASLAHGLFWENDPYWTYWITKTFLITSLFSLTTAVFGIGLAQGAWSLRSAMRRLWTDHVVRTRMYIVSAVVAALLGEHLTWLLDGVFGKVATALAPSAT